MKKNSRKVFRNLIAIVLTAALIALFPNTFTEAAELTTIDSSTFRGQTEISTIHIGSDVTEISSGAFRNLMRLRSITVSESNPFYASYSNCLYNKEMTQLLCYPAALPGAVIPESVVSIGDYALYGLPSTLKEQIRSVVTGQAQESMMEWQVPGAHFVHTESGVKWRMEDGTVKEPDTELMKLTASVVEASTTRNMSQKTQLLNCFNYFVEASEYERKMDVPLGNWTGTYATDILSEGKGNCYNYAAGFAYIAKGLGYDARVCTGTVTSSLGGRTPHAWTEVRMGDNWYIFDAEMQDAKGQGYYRQTYDNYPAGPLVPAAAYTVTY